MKKRNDNLWTVAAIVEFTGSTLTRVRYVIDSAGIKPTAWAGNTRVFAEPDAHLIIEKLGAIDAQRETGGAD